MSEWKGGITKEWSARRGKGKPSKGKTKPKRINPVSEKRKLQSAKYAIIGPKFLTDNPKCFGCTAKSTEVHHSKGRRGDMLLQVEFFIQSCKICHRWVHDNPEAAKEQGWFL